VADTGALPKPIDELRAIGVQLNGARAETISVQSEIEAALDELRSIAGRKLNRSKAA